MSAENLLLQGQPAARQAKTAQLASRSWDAYDAYIFDIDDTLLHCEDAVHYFAFCAGLQTLAGRPIGLEGVRVHGSTDLAILRDAFIIAGVPEICWKPRLGECCACMRKYVEDHLADFRIKILPGVRDVLCRLQARGAVIGLGTGNLEAIARAKLNHCGLLKFFQFGGFSDDCSERPRVIRQALDKALSIAGPRAAVCVIGDTPSDIHAARANGLDVTAVASGSSPLDELRLCAPDRCLASLQDLLAPGANS